jgi:glutamate racemase
VSAREPSRRVVGVFDSGVGGLTVLRALHAALPALDTAYLGDTARVPYGTRSADTVTRYALQAARFLASREPLGLFVIACNTASAVAVEAVQAALDVPVIGVITPTAERAAAASRAGRVGVLGTRGLVLSGAYQRALERARPGLSVRAQPCPLFVPLAEEGWTAPDDPVVRGVVARYVEPLVAEGVDTLVLGCTHYPLLEDAIRAAVGPEVTLVDAAASVLPAVRAVAERFADGAGARASGAPLRRYYVTDLPSGFRAVAERFLGGALGELIEADL